jgi:hypothetical protein
VRKIHYTRGEKKLHVKKSTSLGGLWVIMANEIGFAFGNM